ncbi:MAG: glycoside hydrolase family 31 protein [Clostridia bacterium]|nr:glycoside hydrolase family 31 protein [Clostridia bacterium]
MHQNVLNEKNIRIEVPKKSIFHIQVSSGTEFKETLLRKYKIIKATENEEKYTLCENGDNISLSTDKYSISFDKNDDVIVLGGSKRELKLCVSGRNGGKYENNGFRIEIPAAEKERLFGLGDESRDSVMKRGKKAVMWQQNVVSYGPIPFLVSSEGWGILVNCTYKHSFDICSESKDKIVIDAQKGVIDFYIFLADSMKEIIGLYTDITGKPVMLPKAAYGFTFVSNEEDGARELLTDCLMFRREDIPCDIMGLEPGWMENHYDYTLDKKWSQDRFYIPYWLPENYSGPWSFFYNLRQMGYKFTLWLCCDYDLFWHEEGEKLPEAEAKSYNGADILDDHFSGDVIMDKITRPNEPWFEHLKKFVDQGAVGFKLDGAMQVMEHPDRLWAGKYRDDEIHNLYPVIYVKQMQQGYKEYTGRRSLIYTPSLYAGTQGFAATWAGDTGGGADTLVNVMNMAFCGHSNASCDLDPTTPMGIHYGFLLPWTQMLTWRNWHHPWFLGDELEGIIRDYGKLRSSLFPYIYSMAFTAAKTGLAVVRPLSLMYEDKPEYDSVNNVYMLGDSLLVGVYDMNLTLPEGKWLDYFTGEIYEGGKTVEYKIPQGKGGALLVKEGSILVKQQPKKYLEDKDTGNLEIFVFPGNNCSFNLIEDDGTTYDYLDGGYAYTEMCLENSGKDGFTLCVDVRKTANGQELEITDTRDFDVNIFTERKPAAISCGGEAVDFSYNEESKLACFVIPKKLHDSKKVEYVVKF